MNKALVALGMLLAALAWPASAASAERVLEIAGSKLSIEERGGPITAGDAELLRWVQRSANIVRGYYGFFPVADVAVRISVASGSGVLTGHTNAWPHPVIDVTVGRNSTPAMLLDDWVLVHEMIHLALPDVGEEHNWLAEGVATYVEGIARVQAGNMAAAALWQEYAAQMPKGLPKDDDHGLDHTHTWARTYWGGALYCLWADVLIREQTHGRAGLQDALRAIGRQSGGMRADWLVGRVLATGDAATGTRVLSTLYAQMKDAPVAPDLSGLWRELGVEVAGDQVRLHDDAPLAEVRLRITRP